MTSARHRRRSAGHIFAVLPMLAVAATCSGPADPPLEQSNDDGVEVVQRAIGSYNFTDHVAWSQSPPGGLSPSQVPLFVQLGFDDNQRSGSTTNPPGGMTWATNFFKNLRNPAGSGNAATFDNTLVRVSFYSNTTYISDGFVEDPVLVKKSWRTALTDGHEIGNHTHRHPDGGGFSVSQWTAEMNDNNDWLTRPFVANEPAFSVGSGIGASLTAIEGFRTPFLNYNNNTMTAAKNVGFTYDISIEEGWQLSDDGINFNWPYTLDNGSPGGAAVGKPVGNHSGLWELGAAPFVIPPALRDDLGLTKITGLDYNVFVSANLNKAQALAILKYTLDQRLASNRAPLFVGGHTAIYTSDVSLPNTTPQQRREVIEEFVNYALGKSQVRIVTARNIITWMRNPVALGGSCSPESNPQFCSRLGKNCGTVSGTDNCGAARTVQSCGTCSSPQTCGGGGTPNVCGTPGGGGSTIISASFNTAGNTNGFSYSRRRLRHQPARLRRRGAGDRLPGAGPAGLAGRHRRRGRQQHVGRLARDLQPGQRGRRHPDLPLQPHPEPQLREQRAQRGARAPRSDRGGHRRQPLRRPGHRQRRGRRECHHRLAAGHARPGHPGRRLARAGDRRLQQPEDGGQRVRPPS